MLRELLPDLPDDRKWHRRLRCPCCGKLANSINLNVTLQAVGGHRIEVVKQTGLGKGRGWETRREKPTEADMLLLLECLHAAVKNVEGGLPVGKVIEVRVRVYLRTPTTVPVRQAVAVPVRYEATVPVSAPSVVPLRHAAAVPVRRAG